jgi:DUF4097 and DUF4098 domain-containing protein YvlB
MKRVLIVVALLICAAVFGLWRSHGGVRAGLSRVVNGGGDSASQAATGDEIRKTFELRPGERVSVQGINGRVEIQTSDTKTAEVYVKRTGDNPNSLQRRQMIVEQNPDGLLVRSKQVFNGVWDHLFGHDPREEVIIKAPRQIALSLKGINAKVSVTDIDGPLNLNGLNGNAELGQVSESISMDGINGSIVVGLNKLSDRGARIHGVNGGIELRLAPGLNADLTAKGMNGSVKSEISDVTVEKTNWSAYSARIGSGGPEIEIKGINGNVRLTRSDKPATSAASDQSNSTNPARASRKVD